MPVLLTKKAEEKVKEILSEQPEPYAGLRIQVVGGGCSGFQYRMGFDKNFSDQSDAIFEVDGQIYPSVRVPLREISVKDGSHLRVYDTRGPWGDPRQVCDVRHGLPALRQPWINERGDTVEYEGREIRPEDNGFLSFNHAAQ